MESLERRVLQFHQGETEMISSDGSDAGDDSDSTNLKRTTNKNMAVAIWRRFVVAGFLSTRKIAVLACSCKPSW